MKIPSSLLASLSLRLGRRFVIGVPYVWLLLFFLLPFLILLRISVTDMGNGVDPFVPLIKTVDASWHILLRFGNYVSIFTDTANDSGGLATPSIWRPTGLR